MTPEQQARDLLERMEIDGAQDFSAGELVELANLIVDAERWRNLDPVVKAKLQIIKAKCNIYQRRVDDYFALVDLNKSKLDAYLGRVHVLEARVEAITVKPQKS